MNFNPSILIIAALIVAAFGVAVGSYALLAEYRVRKAAKKTDIMALLKRSLAAKQQAVKPVTRSNSTISVAGGEFDSSQMRQVS